MNFLLNFTLLLLLLLGLFESLVCQLLLNKQSSLFVIGLLCLSPSELAFFDIVFFVSLCKLTLTKFASDLQSSVSFINLYTLLSNKFIVCLAAQSYNVGDQQPTLLNQSAVKSVRLFLMGMWGMGWGLVGAVIGVQAWLVRVIGVGAWVLCEVLCEKLGQGISKLRLMISVWDWGKVTKKLRQIVKQFEKLVIINTFISSSSTRMSITSIVSKPSIIYQLNIIRKIKLKISELLFKPIISSRSIFYAFGPSNYNFDRFFYWNWKYLGKVLVLHQLSNYVVFNDLSNSSGTRNRTSTGACEQKVNPVNPDVQL